MAAVPLLGDLLDEAAQVRPDGLAVVSGDESITFAALARKARRFAAVLQTRGVQRGDRVVICGRNSVDVCAAFWGVLAAGAVAVVVDPSTKPARLAWLVEDCAAAAVLAENPDLVDATARPVVRLGDNGDGGVFRPNRTPLDIDLAAIIYTSGSTGEPKGVMLTHRNMLTAATSICSYLELGPDDVVLCALPLAFDYGLYQLIMSVRQRATLVLERSFHLPVQLLRQIERHRVTFVPVVPTMLAVLGALTGSDHDLSSVRAVTSTAATLSPNHLAVSRRLFPSALVFSMYGLTECKRCTYLPPGDLERKPASVGIPIPNTEMWAVGPDGARLGPNEVGELVVRGATVMAGYWGRPDATAECLRPGPLPGERVLHTGDQGWLDDEGYVYLRGRLDDVVKCRGQKVALAEVEAALLAVDGVGEAVVVAEPDEVLGAALVAFVVPLRPGETSDEVLLAACRRGLTERLETYKLPRSVSVRTALPRTANGKIRRSELV